TTRYFPFLRMLTGSSLPGAPFLGVGFQQGDLFEEPVGVRAPQRLARGRRDREERRELPEDARRLLEAALPAAGGQRADEVARLLAELLVGGVVDHGGDGGFDQQDAARDAGQGVGERKGLLARRTQDVAHGGRSPLFPHPISRRRTVRAVPEYIPRFRRRGCELEF